MSDYIPIKNYSAKALLATGDPDRLITGPEIDAELQAIAVSIATKGEGTGEAVEYDTDLVFVPTWGAGFSADPTGSLRYRIIGDGTHSYVIMTLADNSAGVLGTADANTMSITNIPTAARPDATIFTAGCLIEEAGVIRLGYGSITAAGVMTFYAVGTDETVDSVDFATSGTKGLALGWTLFYPLVITA